MLQVPTAATLSLQSPTDPQATVDAGAIVTYHPSSDGESRDDRAPTGYEIEGELGRGGMGVVYRARQTKLNRSCALKMILAGGHAGEVERERFLTEAQAIARLQHPGIVQVFEVGEHQGHPFIALELCEGGSLDKRLGDRPPTAKEAATIVRDLALAMEAAHEAKVIHRDLKPANVLIAIDGTLKVTDFGLAKKMDENGQTQTGAVMGTPSYMPPEQASGRKDLGPPADIYALGAILYVCLTGRPPFRGATTMETLLQVLETEPVAVRQLNPSVPPDLETICHKCLQKEAGKRYDSAKNLADDLGRFLNGEPIRARPVGTVEQAVKWVKRNPVVSSLLTTVLLVLLVGIGVSWHFAVEANNQANEANDFAKKAEDKTKEADANAKKAEDKSIEAAVKAKEATDSAKKAEDKTKEATTALARAKDQLDRTQLALYAGKLAQAQREFETGNGVRALELLDSCQWNLRGWEHRHLWTRFSSKQIFRGHTSSVRSVCFSPDGKRVLSGSSDSTLKMWDVETAQELLTLRGHTEGVHSVVFSRDGKRIVSAGGKGTVKVWDTESGQEALSILAHQYRSVKCVAFSPDGKRIVSGSASGGRSDEVKIWDTESGKELLLLEGHKGWVNSVAFSPDGNRIVSASDDKTLKLWNADTGREIRTLSGHTAGVLTVSFSPDGQHIVSGSGTVATPGELKVWDVEQGREVLSLQAHTAGISSVQFRPDGQRMVSASYDKTLKIWDFPNGREIRCLQGGRAWIHCVSYSPDGKRLISGSEDGTIKVWDAERGQDVLALKGHSSPVMVEAWSSDSKRIISGSYDEEKPSRPDQIVWDVEKERAMLTIAGFPKVSWSPEGKRITMNVGEQIKVLDAKNGQELLALAGESRNATRVLWSPNGKRIVGYGLIKDPLTLWDAETGQILLKLKPTSFFPRISCVAWNRESNRIVAGYEHDKILKVYDAETGRTILTLKGHLGWITSVGYSRDGKRIVSGSKDRTVKVWDAETGEELLTLKGHTLEVTSVVFSPDGQRIVSGGAGRPRRAPGEVKVWDTTKGQELLTLKGHNIPSVLSMDWSPDGQRIVGGLHDNKLLVWDAYCSPDDLILVGHVGRVQSTAYSPDGKRLVSGSSDGTLMTWDTETGQTLSTLQGHGHEVYSVAWSPDGQRIVSGSRDTTLMVWDANKNSEPLILKGHKAEVHSAAWSPDSNYIASGGQDYTVRIWDAKSGKEIHTLKRHRYAVSRVMWSPDGKQVGSSSSDGTAKVWNVITGEELITFKGDENKVFNCLAWSPDGKLIVTGGNDGMVKVWDAQTGKEMRTVKGHTHKVDSVAWSPDGKQIVTGGNDGMVKVWDAQTGKEMRTLCHPGEVGGIGSGESIHSLSFSADGKRGFAWISNRVFSWSTEPHHRDFTTDAWPLPDLIERKRYHTEQATLAEKEKHWFAVAFHLGRILLDDPENADLKRRCKETLQKHGKPRMIPVP